MRLRDGSISMKILLAISALVELGAGLALLGWPSRFVALLLGEPIKAPAAQTAARIGAAALLALAVACWFGQRDALSRAVIGLVAAMLLYNIAAAAILGFAGLGFGLRGVLLWPGVGLHAAMAVWCVVCLGQAATRTRRGS